MKILGKFFAIIFCVVYFLGLTVIMSVSLVNKLLSGNYYTQVLQDVDLAKIKLSDLEDFVDVNELLDENDSLKKNDSIEETFIKILEEENVDKKTATAIIENKEIRKILGNFIGDYINYNLGGEKPRVSRDDVKMVVTNKDVIKMAGETPTEEDIDTVYNQLNELIEEFIENGGVINGNSGGTNEININR